MLLAVAIHHQQRIVDRDAEADQHHHVLDVGRQLACSFANIQMIPSVTGIGHGAKTNGIRNASVPKTKIRRSSRDRNRDVELADLEVIGEDGVEVVLDRGLSRDVELRPRNRPGGFAHVVGVALRVRRLERRDDDRRRDLVVRHGLDADEPAGRQLVRRALAAARSGRNDRSGVRSLRLGDERERAGRHLAEVIWRIVSARPASVPGNVKRFVSRLDNPDAAQPLTTKSAIHAARTVFR